MPPAHRPASRPSVPAPRSEPTWAYAPRAGSGGRAQRREGRACVECVGCDAAGQVVVTEPVDGRQQGACQGRDAVCAGCSSHRGFRAPLLLCVVSSMTQSYLLPLPLVRLLEGRACVPACSPAPPLLPSLRPALASFFIPPHTCLCVSHPRWRTTAAVAVACRSASLPPPPPSFVCPAALPALRICPLLFRVRSSIRRWRPSSRHRLSPCTVKPSPLLVLSHSCCRACACVCEVFRAPVSPLPPQSHLRGPRSSASMLAPSRSSFSFRFLVARGCVVVVVP